MIVNRTNHPTNHTTNVQNSSILLGNQGNSTGKNKRIINYNGQTYTLNDGEGLQDIIKRLGLKSTKESNNNDQIRRVRSENLRSPLKMDKKDSISIESPSKFGGMGRFTNHQS